MLPSASKLGFHAVDPSPDKTPSDPTVRRTSAVEPPSLYAVRLAKIPWLLITGVPSPEKNSTQAEPFHILPAEAGPHAEPFHTLIPAASTHVAPSQIRADTRSKSRYRQQQWRSAWTRLLQRPVHLMYNLL